MTIPIWRWMVALVILLAFMGFCGVLILGAGEDICFDRSPWWGPPEDPTSTCAGHFYEAWQAGYYPWNMPK